MLKAPIKKTPPPARATGSALRKVSSQMRFSILAVMVFLVLAVPSGASAVVLVNTDGTRAEPFQTWADRAKVPMPSGVVTIHSDDVIATCAGRPACTFVGTTDIWLDGAIPHLLFHELGHQRDFAMAEWPRRVFMRLTGDKRAWNVGPNAPAEQFAEAFAYCAEDKPRLIAINDALTAPLNRSTLRQRRICRLIRQPS